MRKLFALALSCIVSISAFASQVKVMEIQASSIYDYTVSPTEEFDQGKIWFEKNVNDHRTVLDCYVSVPKYDIHHIYAEGFQSYNVKRSYDPQISTYNNGFHAGRFYHIYMIVPGAKKELMFYQIGYYSNNTFIPVTIQIGILNDGKTKVIVRTPYKESVWNDLISKVYNCF